MRTACFALSALSVSLLASTALAQLPPSELRLREPAGMDTHLFRPAIDSKGFFAVNGVDVLGHQDVSFGLVLDYGRNLVRTRSSAVPLDPTTNQPCVSETCPFVVGEGSGVRALVEDSFQGTFNLNFGLFDRAMVGVTLPVVLMTGNRAYQIGPDGGLHNAGPLDVQRVSSISAHGKVMLTRPDRILGIAPTLMVGVPLAGTEHDLGAEPGLWYWPALAIERHIGTENKLRLGINVGYRGHTGENARFGNDTTGQPQLAEGRLEYGNLATFGGAVSYRASRTFDIVAETYGSYLLGGGSDEPQRMSQEIVGGLKLFLERNSYLMLGAGSRFFSRGFQAADHRLILGFVFEPSIDRPPPPSEPDRPRVRISWKKYESDRDGDGIPDHLDKCPNDPETFNGFEDEDGCPDKGLVIVEGSEIMILQSVQFETNSARILPESNAILDAVAATLKGRSELAVVEVAGHADERGSDAHNLRLTKARAAAVADALVNRGIARKRLVSQGYGEYCPLDPVSTPAAWDKNRRVEFKVVKSGEGLTNAARGCARATAAGVVPPTVE